MRHSRCLPVILVAFSLLFFPTGCRNRSEENVEKNSRISEARTEQDTARILNVGDRAADFEVEMLSGERIRLSDLKGKVVLLTFWATWCPPCNQEFKVLPKAVVERFKGQDFVLLPISRGETKETVSDKMEDFKKKGVDFPVGIDPDKSIYGLYARSTIPRNFLIGKDGVIVYCSKGYSVAHMKELTAEIEKQLKQQ